MHRVLLIDDDEALAPPLAAYLRRFEFELEAAHRPSAGLARLAEGGVDAVILDVMLPEFDGFETLRRIRAAGHTLPVLMLTARGELSDRVVGLELGADDYLPKPFEPRELAARLQTILRRVRTPVVSSALLRFDGLEIHTERREVRRGGEPLPLTGTEYELLLLLAREPQKVFTRDEILNRLRGHDAELHSRAVDILGSRLRRKLEPLDLAALAREVAEGRSVALELAEGLGPVRADAARLRLLLRNLLDNAERHGAGDRPPRLFLRRTEAGEFSLGVRDFGPGVPPEVLPRLAEAFYRPDDARTRVAGGVGLGLHLCRAVAEAHGGRLELRNAAPGLQVAMVWRPQAA